MPSDFAGFQCHTIQNRSKKKSKLVSPWHNFWLLYCRITSGFFQYCYVLAAYWPLHGFRFDLREKQIRTFLVARFNFKLSCFTNPPFTNRRFTNPPFTNPCFTNPCFTNPPFTNPCFTNPCMFYKSMFYKSTFYKSTFYKSMFYNPPFTNPCFTNPPFTNPLHVLQIHSTPLHSTPLHSTPCFTICLNSVERRNHKAPVAQRLDNAIQRINHYPVEKCWQNKPRYPLDSDLSG